MHWLNCMLISKHLCKNENSKRLWSTINNNEKMYMIAQCSSIHEGNPFCWFQKDFVRHWNLREREREKRSRKETNLLHSHVHAQNVAPHFIKFTNREIRQISLSACKITVLLNQCCYAFVIGLLLSSCSLHSFAHPVESLSKNPSMNGVKGVWSVQASLSHHTTTLLSLPSSPHLSILSPVGNTQTSGS
jgi:hypothetical protein